MGQIREKLGRSSWEYGDLNLPNLLERFITPPTTSHEFQTSHMFTGTGLPQPDLKEPDCLLEPGPDCIGVDPSYILDFHKVTLPPIRLVVRPIRQQAIENSCREASGSLRVRPWKIHILNPKSWRLGSKEFPIENRVSLRFHVNFQRCIP